MNLSGDGRLDGKFKLQQGQGITQAIAGELGFADPAREVANLKKLDQKLTDIYNKGE